VLTCEKLGHRRLLLHYHILYAFMGVILHQRQLSTEQTAMVSLRPHLLKLGLINPLWMRVKLPKHVLVAWGAT
jgi:hypothetical protein